MDGVLIGLLAMSSRSVIDRRDTYRRVFFMMPDVGVGVQTFCDIDPGEPANIRAFLA